MGSKSSLITDNHALASRGNGSRNGGNGKPAGHSLFDRLGGARAIAAVVDAFYERVLADPQLKPFFEYTDMDWLKKSQIAFLSQAFGGPARYKGQDMKAAHAGLGITESDFNRVAAHLSATLESLGVAPTLIEEVISVAATLAPDVIDRKSTHPRESAADSARGPNDVAFRAMLDSAPINVMMTDKAFNIVYVNPASRATLEKLEKYLPIPVSRVVGSSIDVFHKVPSHQRSLLSNPKNLPHRAKIQIGPETADLLVSPIYDQDGTYLGPMVTWEVITEREKTELEVARLRAMVENAPMNMMLAGTDFVINYVNPASLKTLKQIENLLPVPAEKVLGASIDIFHKNPAHQRNILGNHKNLPHRAQIQIGPEMAELLVSPIFDNKGNFMGPMVTWEIITAKLETERKVKEAAEREKAQAQEMKEKVEVMKRNISNLASSSEELNAISQQMSANSEETSAQATVVSGAAEEVSKNLQTVSTGTEEMMASIKEIAKNANEAAKVATSAVKVAEDTNATVTKLGDSSVEIGKVIKVITSIAQQTNLLALNATIEAARAGEAGKGFAVVANEVKELAKETAKATEEIGQKIQAIQTDSKGAVEAIAQITGIISQINEISTTIASAVEEQAATTTDIGRNVSEAAKGSQEIAHNILGVAQAAQSTTTGAANTQQAAAELARMSTELQEVVGSIRIS